MSQHRQRVNAAPDDEAALQLAYGADAATAAADAIRGLAGQTLPTPAAAIVLGSGLGGLAEQITHAVHIPFHDVPGFPPATVEGHAGAVIAGTLGGRPVICLAVFTCTKGIRLPLPYSRCAWCMRWVRAR